MIRKLLIAFGILIVCALAGLIIFNKPFAKSQKEENRITSKCILQDGKCTLEFKNKPFHVKTTPRKIRPLQQTTFIIENLDIPSEVIKARIYGLNMDMGVIFVEFKKVSKNDLIQDFAESMQVESMQNSADSINSIESTESAQIDSTDSKTLDFRYEAKVFLSSCVVDVMNYRLEFYDELSGVVVDFDVESKIELMDSIDDFALNIFIDSKANNAKKQNEPRA